jgi:hypothetical protein
MKSEIMNYLQTIQDMSNANQPKVALKTIIDIYYLASKNCSKIDK